MEIKRIVIFRLSSIGDIILSSALIRTVRKQYPDAQIDFVVKKQFASLVQYNPHINTVYTINREDGLVGLKTLAQKLRNQQYDVFLDIHKNFRSVYVRMRCGAKQTYIYRKNVIKRSLLIGFGLDLYKPARPVYQRFIDAAKPIGVEDDGMGTEFFVPQHKQKIVDELIAEQNMQQKRIVVLCPGASFKNKQWLPEGFTEVANRLCDNEKNAVVVIGGKAEYEVGEHIRAQSGWRVHNFCGNFDLLESAALIERASVVCANDTGMLHLAEALKIPVVGIYGPTVRQFGFYPLLSSSKVVEVEDLKCRPCTKMGMNHCPKKHFNCMRQITAQQVLGAIESVLQTGDFK